MTSDRSDDASARGAPGDPQASTRLFQRYSARLIALARSRLAPHFSSRIDPEDIVQSAYRSFFSEARAGRYDWRQGGDLWQLLVTIMLHKLQRHVQRHSAGKRDVKRQQGFGSEDSLIGLDGNPQGREPSPLEAVALVDEVEQVMRRLEVHQRRILELRLQGHTIDDIASALNVTERTIRRALQRIKQHLEQTEGFRRPASP